MGLFDGHQAIITGGASGIGAATARALGTAGADVTVIDTDESGAEAVASDIGGAARVADVADASALTAAIDGAAADMGGLSILFNNAGFSSNVTPVHEWGVDEWHRVVAVNLFGVFHGTRAAVPHMLDRGDGRIVNMASISGTRPSGGESPYSASKAGVAALTVNTALDYGPTIRANAVSPGMIDTPLTAPLFEMFSDWADAVVARTPTGRVGEPSDIADVVVFLCSDAARFVNGQNIVIDGGLSLHGSGVDGISERMQALLNPAESS
ncbi:MAG: SDR family oxidoreductase [Acidimicrobiia bacterium]|nr:SDR family oxidoreductase [Acidimicrobiia bacterium]